MIKLFTSFFCFLTMSALAQSNEEYWDKWNKNYPQTDIVELLKIERHYADSVETHPEISPYYCRLSNYRVQAEYLGKTRLIDKNVLSSMKNVYKLYIGNPSQLDQMCEYEVLFTIGSEEIWMPIQSALLKDLENEARKGDKINLYCLYLNEHNSKRVLYNTFLISEFSKYPE